MPAKYVKNAVDVTNRLDELGWTKESLLEVVDVMVSARNGCTDNDPASAPGWMAWKDGTRRLREIGRRKGLQKADFDQLPCVIDPKRNLRFSVTNTDDGTGIEERIPQNRSKKGAATDRAATVNQMSIFDFLTPDDVSTVIHLSPAAPAPGNVVSWFLCVYSQGDDVRAELACPKSVDGGYFSEFYERIELVGPCDGGVKVRRDKPDDGSEFDIPVTRK